jgi:acyl-CoA reductase-like NAD-dependent aldehyde dehydrogenase
MTSALQSEPAQRVPVPFDQLYIDGAFRGAADQRTRDVVDPSTGRTVSQVSEAGSEDVKIAVGAAREAFDSGPWSRMNNRDRGRILLKAASLLRERAEDFAQLESLDTGKPLLFSRMIDVGTAADSLEYYGSLALGIEGATRTTAAPSFAYTLQEPIGVIGAITPFNFPMILSLSKIAPALAAGNTVVHKPAEDTPLTALAMAALLAEAGLPGGVLNVVPGGADAGSAIVTDPRVDKIAFTGSTGIGREIARNAAATLKPVTVELGGKSANLIFADADPDAAVQTAINGFTYNTGQFCMAGTRILVEQPVYEDVVAALSAAAGAIPVGDPFAEGTIIGPMTGAKQLARVTGFVDRARANGSLRVAGGDVPSPDLGGGYYQRPVVVADVTQDSELVQQEIFGPVVTVQPFDDEDHAIRLANSTSFGLAGGLQTSDMKRAHRVAAALKAGTVWVNQWGLLDVQMPIGGYKQSGYGRENGPEGLAEYLQAKSVLIASV